MARMTIKGTGCRTTSAPSLDQGTILVELEKEHSDFEKRTGWGFDSEYTQEIPEELANEEAKAGGSERPNELFEEKLSSTRRLRAWPWPRRVFLSAATQPLPRLPPVASSPKCCCCSSMMCVYVFPRLFEELTYRQSVLVSSIEAPLVAA